VGRAAAVVGAAGGRPVWHPTVSAVPARLYARGGGRLGPPGGGPVGDSGDNGQQPARGEMLKRFTTDLTALAADGKLDPVVGVCTLAPLCVCVCVH
jgi:hypothetical protein